MRGTAIRGSSQAITEQAGRFNGSSNLFLSEPALRLAERISDTSLGGKVFLRNSGAEASECAIKLARKHAHGARRRDTARREPRRRVPRPHDRSARRDPEAGRRGPLRSAAPGLRRCLARCCRCPTRSGHRRHRGRDDRADPGRGRHLPDRRRRARRGAGSLRCDRRPAHLRRGPGGNGEDRNPLGVRAVPGSTRRDDRRQGAGRRPAGRRRRDHAGARRHVRARRPRLDLCRRPGGRVGRAGRARRDRRRGGARERP